MKAVILSGGSIDQKWALSFIQKVRPEYIVAADQGLSFCFETGMDPDCIVGDFDSLNPDILIFYETCRTIPIFRFNPIKDASDTDIAIKKAVDAGADEIYFLGCTGTRLDHVLSNIYNLSRLKAIGVKAWIADPHNLITMPLKRAFSLKKEEQFGKYISYFPFKEEVKGLTIRGFVYEVTDYTLTLGDGGRSVSNELSSEMGSITWESGDLIIVQSMD